jgi:hypothetical protein
MLEQLLVVISICLITPILTHWNQIVRMGKYRVTRCIEIEQKMISAVSHQFFLELNEFDFHDSFRYRNMQLGVWRQNKTLEIERHYNLITSSMSNGMKGIDRTHNPKVFEFVTWFSNDTSLTTTVSSSAFLFPRPPGSFLQSKKTDSVEDLWQYHLEGESFLLNEYDIELSIITNDLEYRINEYIQTQGRYVRKIPFFLIKAPYWLYVHRFKMLGVSVREQFSS